MVNVAVALAIGSLVVAALEITVAGVVLAAAPRRGTNRCLAALLVLKAITLPPGVMGALVDSRFVAYNAAIALFALGMVLMPVYLMFLGFALKTPLTDFLRHRAVRILLLEFMVFGFALPWFVHRHLMGGPGERLPGIGWTWTQTPLFKSLGLLYIAVLAFSLVAAISAFRRTPRGTVQRRSAKAYLLAFTTQDVGVIAVLCYWLTFESQLNAPTIGNMTVNLAFTALVATALLRSQLFDFDLKLKVGVTRGAIAATFLGVFFVVAAIASQYLQQYGFIVGGVAVGLLLLAFVPIQRAAESLAGRLFPGVSDETGYLMRKKVEVYGEALREAMLPDGGLDIARTGPLRKLRASMGLTQRDHDMVLAALAGTSTSRYAVTVAPGATVLGKYLVERELGAGGSGRAFLAEDVRMKRKVVLKVLSGGEQAAAIREARSAAAIEHANVVRIYDVEDLGHEALLVMEYIDGGSLKDRLAKGGALSDAAFARVSDDILAALEAVHAAGAIHRDVKPGNVLLTRAGHAKLADFGIARNLGYEATVGNVPSGSIQYMSPEQARGKRVTAASDLHSAAATLYEAHTGRPLVEPVPGESATEMQIRVASGQPSGQRIPAGALRTWFARALATSPSQRFQSAGEMRTALATALNPRGLRRARAGPNPASAS